MLIVLVAGCSGSGKTTVSKRICDQLIEKTGKSCAILSLDNYQHDFSHLPFDEREKLNFDLPDVTNWELLKEHLEQLKDDKTIKVRSYDFEQHKPGENTFTFDAPDILIIESIHAHYHPEIVKMASLTVFVDASRELCYQRRLARDTMPVEQGGRARTEESVRRQFDNQVWPAYQEHIKPKKKEANTVISNHGQLDTLDISPTCARIQSSLPAEYSGSLATSMSFMARQPAAATQTPLVTNCMSS